MNKKQVKWKHLRRFLEKNGYIIHKAGGDTIISAPKDGNNSKRSRAVVTIGHKCSTKDSDIVWDSYLKAIERAFSITREDILTKKKQKTP